MSDSAQENAEIEGIVVLPCSGLDKEAGSATREISLMLARRGLPLVCPVLFQRSPGKYEKELREGRLVVIDGCRTGCASKLATERNLKISKKLNVTDAAREMGVEAGPDPHLGKALSAILPSLAAALADTGGRGGPSGGGATGGFAGTVSYLEFTIDKFVFLVPDSGYYFNENDCWARVEGNQARLGVSDYIQQSASDMIYFEPPAIGTRIEIFGEAGSLETTKTALDIISPVSGKVVAVNSELENSPELINEDPYERGWAVELELTDFDSDIELLMDCPSYFKYLKQKVEGEHKRLFGD